MSGAQLVIVIDGPAGAGKSTVARRVARALGLPLLDTGAIYRALALRAREEGIDWGDAPRLAQLCATLRPSFALEGELNRVLLDGRDVTAAIREPEISRGASAVSALPEVRGALLDLQRRYAVESPLVAEGRDLGTVVFPDASLKIFLVADDLERARRRQRELAARGHPLELEEVRRQQAERDRADAGRAVAPLCRADDAITVDTSGLDVEQVVERILELVGARCPGSRS